MSVLKLFAGKSILMYGLPIVLVALVASHAWVHHKGVVSERNRNVAAQLKIERASAKLLADETAKVNEANAKAAKLAEQLEAEHADAMEDISAALSENRRLAALNRGLRDPGKRPACRQDTVRGPGPTAGSTEDSSTEGRLSTEAEGLLSSEASEFLIELAAEADRAAQYATTCHRWVMERHDARPN